MGYHLFDGGLPMAFWLYRTEPMGDGSILYRQERAVVLAGGGLIWEACQSQLRNYDVGWVVDGHELVAAAGADPATHRVVIDTSPRRPTVSLFEIRSVAGYSYADWTPLMLTLEELFSDEPAPDTIERMKCEFNDAPCRRSTVRDFLYVTGGYESGTWNWGGNTRTTAVLLWEDAWAFFQQQAQAVA